MNVLDQLPRARQAEARSLLTNIPYAATREEAERPKGAFQAWCAKRRLVDVGRRRLDRDWDRMVTFYRLPQERWKHLRITNPVESPFAAVRLRTAAARRRPARVYGRSRRWHSPDGEPVPRSPPPRASASGRGTGGRW